MREAFDVLEEFTRVPGPSVRIPHWVAMGTAFMEEAVARVTGRPPRAPLAGVRMARYKMFFNPAKAIRELGLPQTPPRQALADAVEWFVAKGYARSPKT